MPQSDELMHYGILGMKWGVRRYQNKDGSLTEKGKLHADKLEAQYNKAAKKLNKINAKYEKKQIKADKKYEKAERKLNGLFGNEEKGKAAFAKANKAQYRANKVSTKGAKWYKAMEDTFGKTYLTSMGKDTVSLGASFIERASNNSRSAYNESVYSQIYRR